VAAERVIKALFVRASGPRSHPGVGWPAAGLGGGRGGARGDNRPRPVRVAETAGRASPL